MKDPKITRPVGVNKDGYASGGVKVEESSQNLHLDPRSQTSIRGRNYVAQGDTVTVKGTKTRKPQKLLGTNMWFSAIKLAVSAGSKIYANKQRTKMAMSDAQLMHASRMAEGKEAYQGKLLEARQSDWKDEAVLIILSAPIAILAWAVVSDDPGAMDKVNVFFEHFAALPSWFTNLWILVVASIYGIKGTPNI